MEILGLLHKSNKKLAKCALSALLVQPERFEQFSSGLEGILLDYSRVHVDRDAMDLLLALADASGLEKRKADLFEAAPVNVTENRPAMHMALRSRELGKHLPPEEFEAMEQGMDRMLDLAAVLHRGLLPAKRDQVVRDIVHVGIGGSLLGTRLLCDALENSSGGVPRIHFLGSVDAHYRERLLPTLVPEETVVILVSKSFSTTDTLMHGAKLMQWLESGLGRLAALERMFAVTGDADRAAGLGIREDQTLFLPSWVGGRYSLWSPVSLSAAAKAGPEVFLELLRGASEMDRHFMQASPGNNLPVLLGLLGVWHRNICGYPSWGVIPYDQRLALLPAHLQQLIMESSGKSVSGDGSPITHGTAPVVFGEIGTDAQHSLFQALHQGSDRVPLNLVAIIRPDHDDKEAHAELLANLLAQATALASGRSSKETRSLMDAEGVPGDDGLVAQRTFAGDRPTELLLLDDLSAANLGKLLALYEHKVFVESVIWGINAFDQWGVELGKSLAPDIRGALLGNEEPAPGLAGLMKYIHEKSGEKSGSV